MKPLPATPELLNVARRVVSRSNPIQDPDILTAACGYRSKARGAHSSHTPSHGAGDIAGALKVVWRASKRLPLRLQVAFQPRAS